MPRLTDTRKKIISDIPSIEGSRVELRDGLLARAVEEIDEMNIKTDFQRGMLMLEKMIEGWNLTDEKDNPIKPTIENLRKLDMEDIDYLLSKTSIAKRVAGLKKK